jgi:hypothetical protein
MLRSQLPHAPARAHGATYPTPRVAEVPLSCGPPKLRPPARLPPPPAAWLDARAGLSSERSVRSLPASVRAASGAVLVIFTALLVVSAPAPTWPAPAPSPAVRAAKSRGWAPQRSQALRRRARYRRAPSRHRCLRHSGSSSRVTAAAAAAAAHAGGRRACAGLDWTDGPQVMSPDSSRPGRRVARLAPSIYRRQRGGETHQQVQAPTLSAVTFIFGLGTNLAKAYLTPQSQARAMVMGAWDCWADHICQYF